jgi:glycosyltransferase involved in cell wall biosynthesis
VDPAACRHLRIAVLSDAASSRNGVGTYYDDLVAQLNAYVERIDLIAPAAGERPEHQWFSIPMPGDTTQRLAWPSLRWLGRFLDERAPHAIVLPTVGPYAVFGLWLARRREIPVCVAHHTNFEKLVELYWHPLLAVPSCSLLSGLTNWLIRRADCVINMNVESLEDARRRGARRARIVGTPLAAGFLDTPRRPINQQLTQVLFLGRLASEKGIDTVLEAAERLPNLRFRIGGDGPLRRTVEGAAERLSNLEYLGWLNRDAVRETLDDSDLLVLPSSMETFGTVALEALARRRLVLVNQDCGITHWPDLAEGLFTMQRDETLAQALARLADLTADQREETAARGWRAVEQFQRETLHGWLDVLSELVQPTGTPSEPGPT